MKIYIPLLLLVILTISFSSCSETEESTTAATSTDPAAITGETMTIGSIDYTSSLISSCIDFDLTSTAGDSVYGKEQIFLYDNKTYTENLYFFSNSSCSTSLSSFTDADGGTSYTSPLASSFDNASFVSVSASQNHTGKVYDTSSNELDNSTYVLLIYNSTPSRCGNKIEVKPVYPKSTSELQMETSIFCFSSRTFNITDNSTMERVYTPQ